MSFAGVEERQRNAALAQPRPPPRLPLLVVEVPLHSGRGLHELRAKTSAVDARRRAVKHGARWTSRAVTRIGMFV